MFIRTLLIGSVMNKKRLQLKRKMNNEHDEFAVAGRVIMRGKFGWIVVGHIPRELSRYV